MKSFLALFLVLAFCGCSGSQKQDQWEYESFKFRERQKDEKSGKFWVMAVFVGASKRVYSIEDITHPTYSETNECSNLEILLNQVGRDGYELACFDGKEYILKRKVIPGNRSIMISQTPEGGK